MDDDTTHTPNVMIIVIHLGRSFFGPHHHTRNSITKVSHFLDDVPGTDKKRSKRFLLSSHPEVGHSCLSFFWLTYYYRTDCDKKRSKRFL